MTFKIYQICSVYSYRCPNFDVRWEQAVLSTCDPPADKILEDLYKSIITGVCSAADCIDMVWPGNYSKRKTTGLPKIEDVCLKLHIDQTMRNKNFKIWNEVVEIGAAAKGQKRKKFNVERKVGEYDHWKANGQCSKGDSCSFRHDQTSGDRCLDNISQRQSSPPTPKAKTQTDNQTLSKSLRCRGVRLAKRVRFPCRFREKCANPSCSYWRLPVCQNYMSETGPNVATNVISDMLRRRGSPARSRRKEMWKDQLPYWNENWDQNTP